MSTTRQGYREAMHDLLYAGSRGFRRLRNGPDATGLTEFTTNMVSVTDTAFQETMLIGNEFIGGWIRLAYVDNASALQERVSRITAFEPSAGTITFSPAIGTVNGTAANVNGRYEIWPDVHPDEADNAINRILENLPYRATLPVTMVADGDMEDTGVASWAELGTATTHEKTTAVTLFGRQNVHQVAASASDGFTSNSVLVTPNEPLYLTVPLRADTPDWTVTLYDATGSASIDTTDVTDTQLLEVRLSGNAPASCNSATVRFEAGAGTDEIYVGPVSLLSGWRNRYPLDSTSVTRAEDVLRVFTLPAGTSADDDDTYVQFPKERDLINYDVEFDERAGVPLNIVLEDCPSGNPVYMEVLSRHVTLSADDSTSVADKDTVVNGALYYVEKARGDHQAAYRYLRMFNILLEKQGNVFDAVKSPRRVAVRMG